MSDAELCYLTATEALASFKRRSLSPVELMRAVIARCEEVNPKVNAFTYTFFDEAMAAARKAERRYARGLDTGALEGLSLAVKDLHPVKGQIATWGSKVYENAVAEATIPTVQRMLDAGAILHARTTTPEFGHTGHCHTPLWGITRNPWNLQYSSGGSSGGAGPAVATGMTALADGSDGGGSIRIPASACGIFGFKPPFGRNPAANFLPTNNWSFLHFGPMTRSVADAALMQNVMSGPCTADINSLKPKLDIPSKLAAIKGMKIAFSMDLGYFEVDREVQHNTRETLRVFKSLGCKVREVDVGWTYAVYDAWLVQWTGMFAAFVGHHLPRWGHEMDPYVRGLLERGVAMSAVRANQTMFVQTEMWKSLGPILEDNEVLLCPTLAVPSVKADHRCDDPDFRINDKRIDAELQWCMTYPFNLVPQCPVATVPSGFASNGVPTGLQIVGRTYDDIAVFRAAAAFEKAQPWLPRRPCV